MPTFPLESGIAAVRHARHHAEAEVRRVSVGRTPIAAPGLEEPRGAFVTLWNEGALRGCVGYVEPTEPLHDVLARAARGAVRDPRFDPVLPHELPALRVEVSVLSPPQPLRTARAEDLPDLVRVGDHGLVVEAGRRRGLLLPQVAVEHGFTAEEFLAACCEKAGLMPEAWRTQALRWHVFEAHVFEETGPRGRVESRRSHRPETA